MRRERAQGQRLAEAAAGFVGVPFRLFGREPARGLDCVGLVHASLAAMGHRLAAPQGYGLRNTAPEAWFGFAEVAGFEQVKGRIAPGDVVMVQPGPGQQHLIVAENGNTGIHAHAGLRRVVRQPIAFPDAPLAHWRLP
ncbi:NlpC/P60 family protein [Qipengyuania sp. ASV99]|uniref:NlpC/P60 family protein n=1 Tax=Qipengyuania sp. ASV99 TaxID=3399681 RepID=UPI003A4C605A